MPKPREMLPNRPPQASRTRACVQHPVFRLIVGGGVIALGSALIWWGWVAWKLMELGTRPPDAVFAGLSQQGIALAAAGSLILYLLMVWLVERRRAREFAIRRALSMIGLGLLTGLALVSAQVALLWLAGGYVVDSYNGFAGLGQAALIALAIATLEEVIYRGVVFRLLEEIGGTWVGLILSSLLFGAAHFGNPNATLWSSTAIALEAGLLLGAAFAASRTLWLPIALHFAWNFTEGDLFGLPISGHAAPGVLTAQTNGPWWVTGGDFGLEASVPTVIMCLGLAGIFLWQAHRRGRIMPTGWARPATTDDAEPAPQA